VYPAGSRPERRHRQHKVLLDRRRSDEDLADHLFTGGYRPAADARATRDDLVTSPLQDRDPLLDK
jgi:hypothetical protein